MIQIKLRQNTLYVGIEFPYRKELVPFETKNFQNFWIEKQNQAVKEFFFKTLSKRKSVLMF